MSVRLLFIAIIILSLGLQSVIAQDDGCGTIMNARQKRLLDRFSPNLDIATSRIAATTIEIAISAHIVRKDDGTGGLTDQELSLALEDVNFFFSDADLHFFLIQKDYIDATVYYDFVSNQEINLALGYDVENTINVYFVNSMKTAEGLDLCGYTYLPGGPERIVLDNDCAISGNTFSHEMGHFFSLYHTHGLTSSGTDELVDGSNCTVAGDEICDTPADPVLSVSKVNSSCVYIGTEVDANDDLYTPNVNNMMSYAPKQCRDEFSAQQYLRMSGSYAEHRSNLYSSSVVARFQADETIICEGNSVIFENASINAESFEWEFAGGNPATSTLESPEVSYATLGTYDVLLIVTDSLSSKDTLILEDYISVQIPERPLFTERYEGFEADITTEVLNPDHDSTFVYVDSVSFQGTHSAFINFYEYPDIGEEDYLVMPSVNTEINKKVDVNFQYAYTYYDDGEEQYLDELQLVYRHECDKEWNIIWQESGVDLATATATSISFVPVLAEWKSESMTFTVPDSIESIEVAFKTINGFGNNLYLDDINVTTGSNVDFGTVNLMTDPVSCYGDSDGSMNVSITGSASSFSYSLDNITYNPSGIYNGLDAGQYLLYILKDGADTLMQSFAIENPDSVVAQYQLDVPSCSSGGQVNVMLSGVGGTGSYQYKLDAGVFGSVDTFEDLSEGVHTGYVVDDNGCEDSVDFTVVPYDSLQVEVTKSDILCFGANDGFIGLEVLGGIEPVNYYINGVSYDTVSEFSGLKPGIYEVSIKDQTLCGFDTTLEITQPFEVQLIVGSSDATCANQPNGLINAVATGGNGGFTYSIDFGQTWQSSGGFENLSKGEYSIFAVDQEGCEYSEEVVLDSPEELILDFTVEDEQCYNSETGSMALVVSGGAQPYTLIFQGDTLEESEVSSLSSGIYEVEVIDAMGCIARDSVVIGSVYDSISSPKISLSGSKLSVESRAGYKILWYRNGIPVWEGVSLELVKGGRYAVAYVDNESSCSSDFDVYTIPSFKKLAKEITVGPNPVENHIQLYCPEIIQGTLKTVSVFDISGNEVVSMPFTSRFFFNEPPGLYFVVVEGRNFITQIRVSKK